MKIQIKKYISLMVGVAITCSLYASVNSVMAKAGDYYDVNSKKVYSPSDLTNIENIKQLMSSMRKNHKIIFEFRTNVYLDYVKCNDSINTGKDSVRDVLTKNEYRVNSKDYNDFLDFNECEFDVSNIY